MALIDSMNSCVRVFPVSEAFSSSARTRLLSLMSAAAIKQQTFASSRLPRLQQYFYAVLSTSPPY